MDTIRTDASHTQHDLDGAARHHDGTPADHPSPVHRVSIDSLLPADSPRGPELDHDHVRSLAVVEGPLPPITVHRPTMRVVDGTHRLRAAAMRGETDIDVRYFDGTAADAFVLAVEANAVHGLPLTPTQRAAAAARILLTHPQWSDRAIASVTGLANKTVAALRRRDGQGAPEATARLGRDGKLRPLDSTQGRLAAGRLLAEQPQASLRDIARRAGVSPTTARDVRDRLHRGEDPVPPGLSRTSYGGHRTRAPQRVADKHLEAIFHSLCRDPSLRLTDTGRLLLRMLEMHSSATAHWENVVTSVPPHCADAVSAAAIQCAEAWREFACRLQNH